MKRIDQFAAIILLAVATASCGGQQPQEQGISFAPKERTSSLTDAERKEAIAQKKESYNVTIPESQLSSHGLKFSILQPIPQGEDITEEIAQRISTKMLQLATQNGISGLGTNPCFVLGVEIAQTGRTATSTAPQKMMVQYELTFKVVNALIGDVYATHTQEVTGVGRSFQEASLQAVREIQNTPEFQEMLATASSRIIDWYNSHLEALKSEVASAEGKGEIDFALALVESVPEEAAIAFKYAQSKQPGLLKQLKHQYAAESLSALRKAIAEANEAYSPAVAGCLQMVPEGTPEAKEAQRLYTAYEKRVAAKAAADNQMKALEAKRAHEKELAQIEANKLKCKYEQMATAKVLERSMRYESDQRNKGFWAKLGNRILNGIDYIGDKTTESEFE